MKHYGEAQRKKKGKLLANLAFGLILALTLSMVWAASAQEAVITAYGLTIEVTATRLDLSGINVQDMEEFFQVLDQLPHLQTVDMYDSKLKRAQIYELAEKYPSIRFGWTLPIGDHKVRTDATAFSTLHNNKSAGHRSSDFELLKFCWQLQALDIGHNLVDDISFLEYLPDLKILILACNKIEDIEPLRHLKKLEYLELFKNHITDISALEGMENLLDLNLCFNYLRTEDKYEPLKKLTSLRRLWLYNSNNYSASTSVEKAWVAALQEALPACLVNSRSYSTLGGWRENPRYDTVYEVFETGIYKPFDD